MAPTMASVDQLIRRHRLDQISNGAAAAGLVVQLGVEFVGGRLTQQGFIESLVAADLLSHQAATRLAASYVQQLRAAMGVDGSLVAPAFDYGASIGRAVGFLRDLDQARTETRDWDTEYRRIIEQLGVRADWTAKNAGRATVADSAAASGRTWRRVSDGNPCSFCAMLIARGPVYTSAESARSVVGRRGHPRGSQPLAAKYHLNCGCSVVEVIGTWTPTAEEQRYVDLYTNATRALAADGTPATVQNVQSKMRELGRGVINDAHVPKTQTGGAGGSGGGGRPPIIGLTGDLPSWEERQRNIPETPGKVTTPQAGPQPEPHEVDTAHRLAKFGVDVEFREVVYAKNAKNPDVYMLGETWEFKSPQGSSENSTIYSQFKRAKGQSENLLIDLARCGLPDEVAVAQIERRFYGQKRYRQVLIVDHQGRVIHHVRP